MIDASSIERIDAHLEDIGVKEKVSTSPRSRDTLEWLSQLDESWLLLFDNADDPGVDLYPFFPACSHGNILITTRNPECAAHAFPPHASWKVSDLALDDAVELLFSASGRRGNDDWEQAARLVRELGLLALAIVQAGSSRRSLIYLSQPISNDIGLIEIVSCGQVPTNVETLMFTQCTRHGR